jgi:hypothetical protein
VIKKTFTAMIEGTRDAASAAGLIEPGRFHAGIRDLYRTAEPDGVFCYTFFKATARKPGESPGRGDGGSPCCSLASLG